MDKVSYQPPSATKIAKAQNLDANLMLLLAQRRFYSRAKFWTGLRGVGVGVIAVMAPILTALCAAAAVPAATVAAVWYVLNRVLFQYLERKGAARGATVQEQFDTAVFAMPTIAVRAPQVPPEDIARITGARSSRGQSYATENLKDWYSIQPGISGSIAIAIAQRGNVAYTRRLLNRHATLWLTLIVTWAAVALLIGVGGGFSATNLLLALVIPVLPPLVDAWHEFLRVRAASREREALANEIQDAIEKDKTVPISPDQLMAWQSQLFALRRDAPLVPDWLYKVLRDKTEAEMSEAAETIGSRAREEGAS